MISQPGKGLKEHLSNVRDIGMEIYNSRWSKWQKDLDVTKTLENILYIHDYGKATSFFQEYIKDTEQTKYKKSPYKIYKSHGLLSAVLFLYINEKQVDNFKLSTIGYMIIKKHHGNLENFSDEMFSISDYKILLKQANNFCYEYFNIDEKDFLAFLDTLHNDRDMLYSDRAYEEIKKFTLDDYMLCNYLFSILINSDKGEAIYHSSNKVSILVLVD